MTHVKLKPQTLIQIYINFNIIISLKSFGTFDFRW